MPWEKAWGATNGNGKLKVPFPPTAFYMMARDPQTERQINAAIRIFKANKVNSQYVYVSELAPSPPTGDSLPWLVGAAASRPLSHTCLAPPPSASCPVLLTSLRLAAAPLRLRYP